MLWLIAQTTPNLRAGDPYHLSHDSCTNTLFITQQVVHLAYSRSVQTMVTTESRSSSAQATSLNMGNWTGNGTTESMKKLAAALIIVASLSAACHIAALVPLGIYCDKLSHSSDRFSLVWLCISIGCCAISTLAAIVVLITEVLFLWIKQRNSQDKRLDHLWIANLRAAGISCN